MRPFWNTLHLFSSLALVITLGGCSSDGSTPLTNADGDIVSGTGGAGTPGGSGGAGAGSSATGAGGSAIGAGGLPDGAGEFTPHVAGTFVHPGTRGSAYELNYVKDQIAAGAQPWTLHFDQAKNAGGDSQALGKALAWYLSDDTAYADAAIAALNGWVGAAPYEPAPVGGGNQSSLEGAWAASVLGPAADILSTYSAWSEADRTAVEGVFRTVFLPALEQMSHWNGNVDLTQIDALLSVAVFLEDEEAFQLGITRLNSRLPAYFYLASDDPSVRNYGGSSDWNWEDPHPIDMWKDGLTQETCRDNLHHAQFAIAAALSAMETAWLQGVDVYTPHQDRMVAALELMGLQLTSGTMQNTCVDNVTTADRYNTLEIGYNHYHNRMGLDLPQTLDAIVSETRSGDQQFNMFHETLTHGDIVY